MKPFHTIALCAALLTGMAGCKPDITGELGEPTDKVKGLDGTWELTQFVQQDPNNPILEERDLSEFYIADGITPMRLTINNSERTFSVENTMGKNYFGNGGTWELDDYVAPSSITFLGDSDTLTMDLASMVLPNSQNMGVEYHRSCSDGFKHVIYKFYFQRID